MKDIRDKFVERFEFQSYSIGPIDDFVKPLVREGLLLEMWFTCKVLDDIDTRLFADLSDLVGGL